MTTSTTDDARTDTETITIPVAPPREPGEFRATDHFRNRLRERVDDHHRDELPATLIRRGRVRRVPTTSSTADVPDRERGTAVAFSTATVTGRPWTLVAALRPRAFVDDDEHHRAITIFQGTPRTADDVAGDVGGDT